MNETAWTKLICEYLECNVGGEVSIVITPFTSSRMSHHGISDRHFNASRPDWTGFVEFKGIVTDVTKSQTRFLRNQNLVRPHSAFIWRQVNDGLLVRLMDYEGIEIGFGSPVECLVRMSEMCGIY